MKLAIDARMVNSSGIGRALRNVLAELAAAGEKDILLLGKREELEPWLAHGWDFMPFQDSIYSPLQHFRFPLPSGSAEVYYCPHILFPFLSRPGKRMVVTVHDCFHLHEGAGLNLVERLYMRMYYRRSVKAADLVICDSGFTKTEILRMVDKSSGKKIQIVYNTLEATFRLPVSGHKKPSEGEEKTCLFVGNIKPHKNLANLVRAFSDPRLADARLLVVGKKDGFIKGIDPGLQSLMEGPNVRFTGFVSDQDLISLYRSADMLVLASLYEGFGLPPLEALSQGTPVVLSDIPVFRELYGGCALFADPGDPADLARVIRSGLDLEPSRRNELLENARSGILVKTLPEPTSALIANLLLQRG